MPIPEIRQNGPANHLERSRETQFMRPRIKIAASRLLLVELRRVPPPQKTTDRFYSTPDWKNLMVKLIRERGRQCQVCKRTGCRVFGDHIDEISDGGALLDPANIILRCGSCHTSKTMKARKERSEAIYD